MDTRSGRKKKSKKGLYWFGGIVLALLLIFGGTFFYLYNKVENTISSMHDPLEREDSPERQVEIESILKDTKALNVLLLGVDEREGDVGRSDTMILMSLNPLTDSMLMLSIPRDTYVDIPGRGMDKINHAYAFGDVELAVQTVENTFDLPVHFYARVNMEGFQEGIDALGGITVENDLNFNQGGTEFPVGKINLDGKESLDYIRMRKKDPRGDLGRNERQRKVVIAAIDEVASFSSITKVGSILDIVGGNVKTDLDMDRMKSLFKNYRGTRNNIKTIEVKGDGQTLESIWYYMVSGEEFNRIHTEVTEHMTAN